jgi:hypothetical protein
MSAGRDWGEVVADSDGRETDGSWRVLKADVALEKKRLLVVGVGVGDGAGVLSRSLLDPVSLPFPFTVAHCSSESLASSLCSSFSAVFDDSRGGVAAVESTAGVAGGLRVEVEVEAGRTRLNSDATPATREGAAGVVGAEASGWRAGARTGEDARASSPAVCLGASAGLSSLEETYDSSVRETSLASTPVLIGSSAGLMLIAFLSLSSSLMSGFPVRAGTCLSSAGSSSLGAALRWTLGDVLVVSFVTMESAAFVVPLADAFGEASKALIFALVAAVASSSAGLLVAASASALGSGGTAGIAGTGSGTERDASMAGEIDAAGRRADVAGDTGDTAGDTAGEGVGSREGS